MHIHLKIGALGRVTKIEKDGEDPPTNEH